LKIIPVLIAGFVSVALGTQAGLADTPKNTLVIARTLDGIITLDPAEAGEDPSYEVLGQVYDKLIVYDPSSPTKLANGLLDSWSMSDDGMTMTLKLRDGVKFHSGNPLTADDAVFSLQRTVLLNRTPSYLLTQFGLTPDNVKQRLRATGPDTLVFEIGSKLSPDFVLNVLNTVCASVVDRKTAMSHEANGDLGNAWLKSHDAGSGPYELASWTPNESVILKAFDGYWGPKANLKRVVFRHVPDQGTRQLMLQHGDVDIALDLGPSQLQALAADKDVKVQTFPLAKLMYLAMGQSVKELQNPKVREALRYLIDYQSMADTILKGQFQVHQSWWPAGAWASLEENPFHYDPAKAKQLLAEAGYPDGLTLKLQTANQFPEQTIAPALQAGMAKGGVKLELDIMDPKALSTIYRGRKGQLVLIGWTPDFLDPHANASSFAWNPKNTDDSTDHTVAWRVGWDIPDLTKETDALWIEPDHDKRGEGYVKLQRDMQSSSPFAFMFQGSISYASRANIGGIVQGPLFDQVTLARVTK
jgi:peptide/nickel transport system substrate-binding protein